MSQNAGILWFNYLFSGNKDERFLHAGCPVLIGEKWGEYPAVEILLRFYARFITFRSKITRFDTECV